MFSKRFIIHGQRDCTLLRRNARDPGDILLRRQFLSVFDKPEGDVIAEAVVACQDLQFRLRMLEDMMRTSVLKYPLDAIDNGTAEPEAAKRGAEFVVVDELRIAEHLGYDAEVTQYFLLVFGDLKGELVARHQTGEGMVVGFAEQLH